MQFVGLQDLQNLSSTSKHLKYIRDQHAAQHPHLLDAYILHATNMPSSVQASFVGNFSEKHTILRLPIMQRVVVGPTDYLDCFRSSDFADCSFRPCAKRGIDQYSRAFISILLIENDTEQVFTVFQRYASDRYFYACAGSGYVCCEFSGSIWFYHDDIVCQTKAIKLVRTAVCNTIFQRQALAVE